MFGGGRDSEGLIGTRDLGWEVRTSAQGSTLPMTRGVLPGEEMWASFLLKCPAAPALLP